MCSLIQDWALYFMKVTEKALEPCVMRVRRKELSTEQVERGVGRGTRFI